MAVELIYCAGKNRAFDQAAHDAGFMLGARLPCPVYLPIQFADQDWKKPDRVGYMASLAQHRPAMASMIDIEQAADIPTALNWAEEAAQYVGTVVLIPKVSGVIAQLPQRIAGADVRLAYSVPTKYAGAVLMLSEFGRMPVHLLGGSPQAQMRLRHYLNVVSADGNMANRMAMNLQYWTNGDARFSKDYYWPKLREAGIEPGDNGPLTAFALSCQNIIAAWRRNG